LVADRAYDANVLRHKFHQRGIAHVIPERREAKRKWRRRGRPPKFCAETYRRRNVIERLVGWLKEHRRLATRFDKLASSFLAMAKLAFIRRYLKKLFSDKT